MNSKTITAKVGGRTHEIPEMWIVGYTHGGRRTLEEAIRSWHEQTILAR